MEDNSGNDVLPVVQFVGQTEVILQCIFQFLDEDTLKKCRLVCQKWNFVSQSLFKRRMKIVFRDNAYASNPYFYGDPLKFWRSTKKFNSDFQKENANIFGSFNFHYKYGLLDEKNDLEFLEDYGCQMKNLTMTLGSRKKTLSLEQIVSFRRMVFKCAPNVEHLALRIPYSNTLEEISPYLITIWNTIDEDQENTGTSLKSLKSIRVFFGISGDLPPSNSQNKLLSDLIFSFVKDAKYLKCIEMNVCSSEIGALQLMDTKSLRNIKDLSLTDWRCFGGDICSALAMLAKFSQKGDLALDSFSIYFSFKRCDNSDLVNIVRFLLLFLNNQKNYLKDLRINFPGFTPDKIPVGVILEGSGSQLKFPTMFKVESLELSNSHSAFMPLFPNDTHWTALFPNLKVLEHSYLMDMQEIIFPKILKNLACVCETLTTITLNLKMESRDVLFRFPMFDKKGFSDMLDCVKVNFPNVTAFTFYHQQLDQAYICHSKNIDDLIVIAGCGYKNSTSHFDDLGVRHGTIGPLGSDDEFDEETSEESSEFSSDESLTDDDLFEESSIDWDGNGNDD